MNLCKSWRPNQRGFSHLIFPLIAIIGVAIVGTVLIHASRAASNPYSGTCTSTIISTSTKVTTTKYKDCIFQAQELMDAIQRENYKSYRTAIEAVPDTFVSGNEHYLTMNSIYSTATAYAVKALPGNGTNNALTNSSTTGSWQLLCSDAVSAGLAVGGKAATYTLTINKNVTGEYNTVTNATTFKATCGNLPSTTTGGGGTSTTGSKITAGNSKANCIDVAGGTYGEVSATNIAAAEKATGLTYNCLETIDNPVDNWTDWEAPWQFTNDPSPTASGSWENWLAKGHQMILGVDLIPQSAPGSVSNPLEWEEACDSGDYNSYATQLAKNLVSYGAGGITIRLGIEANGSWEADFVGTTTTEMSDWAKCYDNEVTAMRAVTGAAFLFVWNPNICTLDLTLSDWYPGNSYVNIIGADAYDNDCHYSSLETVSMEGWQAYYIDSASYPDSGFPSLSNIEAFAKANNKPMSFPEWGLSTGGPDDSTYVTSMGEMFNSDDFSFESYFDDGGDGIAQLGSAIPNATAAYTKEFK